MLTSDTASTAGASCHTTAMTTSTTDSRQLAADRTCTGLYSRAGTAGRLPGRSHGLARKSVAFSWMDRVFRSAAGPPPSGSAVAGRRCLISTALKA